MPVRDSPPAEASADATRAGLPCAARACWGSSGELFSSVIGPRASRVGYLSCVCAGGEAFAFLYLPLKGKQCELRSKLLAGIKVSRRLEAWPSARAGSLPPPARPPSKGVESEARPRAARRTGRLECVCRTRSSPRAFASRASRLGLRASEN